MRKIITTVSLAAAAFGTAAVLAAPADAAVSYEGTHEGVVTGHIDKPDVQAALGGLNENQIQTTPVTFSTTFSSWTDKSWTCNNGEVRHNVKTATFDMDLTKSEVRTGAGNKIKGWDLTGMGALTNPVSTTTGSVWLDCNGAGGFTNYASMHTAQDHALGDTLKVNGVVLPETPLG